MLTVVSATARMEALGQAFLFSVNSQTRRGRLICRVQVCRNQELDWMTGQVVRLLAEHFLRPPVGQHENAVAVGQHHPVLQGIRPRCAWQRPRKVSLRYGLSKMFWPNGDRVARDRRH